MTTTTLTLADRARDLVAQLPETAAEMTAADLDRLAELHREVARRQNDALATVNRTRTAIDLAPARASVEDVLVADEAQALDAALTAFCDLRAASAAIRAWTRRSGTAALLREMTA